MNLPGKKFARFEEIEKLSGRPSPQEIFQCGGPDLNSPGRRQDLPDPRDDDRRAVIRGDILELCVLREEDQILRLKPVADRGIRQTPLAQDDEMLDVVVSLF